MIILEMCQTYVFHSLRTQWTRTEKQIENEAYTLYNSTRQQTDTETKKISVRLTNMKSKEDMVLSLSLSPSLVGCCAVITTIWYFMMAIEQKQMIGADSLIIINFQKKNTHNANVSICRWHCLHTYNRKREKNRHYWCAPNRSEIYEYMFCLPTEGDKGGKKSQLSIINFMNNNNHSSNVLLSQRIVRRQTFFQCPLCHSHSFIRSVRSTVSDFTEKFTWKIQHSLGHKLWYIQEYEMALAGQERGKLQCLSV